MKTNRVKEKSESKVWILNGLIAAMYIAVAVILQPIASGPVQFRVSESLNHLVVFNRKMMWGVLGGVLIYNMIWGLGVLDVLFGGLQTFLCLATMALVKPYIKEVKWRLVLNTLLFTISMALIAWMIVLTSDTPEAFWPTYGSTALSEFATMAVSAPVMYLLDRRLNFANQM